MREEQDQQEAVCDVSSSSSDSFDEEILQLTAMDMQETLPLEPHLLNSEAVPGSRLNTELIATMSDEFGVC